MSVIIELKDVVKRYGKTTAVNRLSLTIQEGEVFGLLGPNGAGKTTTIELIEGLRRPDAGTVRVAGLDPSREGTQIKEMIGVQLETGPLYPLLTVREVLHHTGRYYRRHRSASQMMELMNLGEKANSYVRYLSRGQRQRLALGLALINEPRLVFLDEPTAGLDPQGRKHIWDIISCERTGKTVMLTTHYMEEAEAMCDRVGIIDHGQLITLGRPSDLIAEHSSESWIEFDLPESVSLSTFEAMPQVSRTINNNGRLALYTDDSFAVLSQIMSVLGGNSKAINYLTVRRGSLEDVFLKLTGRRLRE
jgi:ABC-2 type transport system ATP-binding protein